jgi:hypothetical protein
LTSSSIRYRPSIERPPSEANLRRARERFRSLHHPQRRWRKTLQSLKVRYRRPYTARQTSVSWSLMAGKNPLWVAKQHGHSIATMLRAYAAWAEGTAEVDVEAIKRSMNASEATPTAGRPTEGELAGVEGFEPPNGGIKARDRNQHNQQVAETTDRVAPLHTPRFPVAATKPATSDPAAADVLGSDRGTTNHFLLSANLRTRYGTFSRYSSSGRRRISVSPGTIRRKSRKVALRLKQNLIGPPSGDCPWSV